MTNGLEHPDLAGVAAEMRAEWRAEQEDATEDAAAQWRHSRTLEDWLGERMHAVPFRAQVVYDSGGEVRVVLDYEDPVEKLRRGVHVGPAGATGQASTNCAPCPTPSLCALTRPPASCIKRRTMYKPSPVPK